MQHRRRRSDTGKGAISSGVRHTAFSPLCWTGTWTGTHLEVRDVEGYPRTLGLAPACLARCVYVSHATGQFAEKTGCKIIWATAWNSAQWPDEAQSTLGLLGSRARVIPRLGLGPPAQVHSSCTCSYKPWPELVFQTPTASVTPSVVLVPRTRPLFVSLRSLSFAYCISAARPPAHSLHIVGLESFTASTRRRTTDQLSAAVSRPSSPSLARIIHLAVRLSLQRTDMPMDSTSAPETFSSPLE